MVYDGVLIDDDDQYDFFLIKLNLLLKKDRHPPFRPPRLALIGTCKSQMRGRDAKHIEPFVS